MSADPKTKLEDELIHKLQTEEKVNDALVGKHMLCMFTKMHIMNENGDIDADVLRTKAQRVLTDQDKLDALIKRCSVKEPGSAEDAAIQLLKCIEKDVPIMKHQST
ncbi:unnamed protein product [Diabrotica balteata]|uniref:Uncharacterized protein n=1 Tax=Diabrotica balteata TaxID=107213 RepID=A0A9N9SUW6_DIABA|nr:unnamed protein product [Diabrotica balteata]